MSMFDDRVCRTVAMEISDDMALLALLAVPGTAALLIGLLVVSALVEQRVLCPRALIVGVARAKSTSPEYTETLVAREFERLLRTSAG
jgi:hypothetical protein